MTNFNASPAEPTITGPDLIGLYQEQVLAWTAQCLAQSRARASEEAMGAAYQDSARLRQDGLETLPNVELEKLGRALLAFGDAENEAANAASAQHAIQRRLDGLLNGQLHGRLAVATTVNPNDFIEVDISRENIFSSIDPSKSLPEIDFSTWGQPKTAPNTGITKISGTVDGHYRDLLRITPFMLEGKLPLEVVTESGDIENRLIKLVSTAGLPLVDLELFDVVDTTQPAIGSTAHHVDVSEQSPGIFHRVRRFLA